MSAFTSAARRRAAPWVALGLILVATVTVYRGVIGNGFVLDDFHVVRDNPSVRSLAFAGRWFTVPDAVSSFRESRNYRPVLVASYAADYALWGGQPQGFHATNLGIHAGVVLLTFLLARRLWSGDDVTGLCAAGVVALHPINAEAVNYITARSSSLMTLFVLAAVWAYDRGSGAGTGDREGVRNRLWQFAAYVLGGAALGTKEVAVVLPVLIIAWDRVRHDEAESWGAILRRSVPWWGLVAIYLSVRLWVLPAGVTTAINGAVTAAQNALFALKVYLLSLGFWLWPTNLAVDHAWPITIGGGEAALLIGGSAIAVLGTIGAARFSRRIGWCLVWFWAAIAPVGALPFVSRLTLYQDNRVYLSGIALAWLVARVMWRVSYIQGLSRVPRAAWLVGLIGCALVAARVDARRTQVWTDDAHLWEDVMTKYPDSVLAYNAKAVQFINDGRLDEARQALERALRLVPGYSGAQENLGIVFSRLGDTERAVALLESALKINPNLTAVAIDLARIYEQMGRTDRAFEVYEHLLESDPEMTVALARSGLLLERKGRYEEAAERYRNALAVDPNDDQTRGALGGVLVRLERWAEAHTMFDVLVKRHPDFYPTRFKLGVSLDELGRYEEALEAYRAAAALRPDDPDLHFRIAVIYSKRGRWAEASAEYERTLERDSRHFPSHMNLALVAERLGDDAGAVTHYRAFMATAPAEAAYDAPRAQAREAILRLGRGSIALGRAGEGR